MRLVSCSVCLMVALSMCHAGQAGPALSRRRLPIENAAIDKTRNESYVLKNSNRLEYLRRVWTLSEDFYFGPKCVRSFPLASSCEPFSPAEWDDPCYCHVDVDDHGSQNSYCCNFFGYEANLTSHTSLNFKKVALRNTPMLDLTVNPTGVETIYINKSAIGRINKMSDSKSYPMKLLATFIHSTSLPAFSWMYLHHSRVDEITANTNVNEIHITNSNVGSISNITVFKLDPRSVRDAQLVLKSSNLAHLSNIAVDGTTLIEECHINSLMNCTFQKLTLRGNIVINAVYPGGLVLDESPVAVGRLIFGHLHRGAVIAKSVAKFSSFGEAIVHHCDEPCFRLTDGRAVHFIEKPQRAKGTFFPNKMFFFLPIGEGKKIVSDLDKGVCRGDPDNVVCDEPLLEGSDLVLQNEGVRDTITISHQKDVTILGGNYIRVSLVNVTGSYLAYNTLHEDPHKTNSSYCKDYYRSLAVDESILTSLFSKSLTEAIFYGLPTTVRYLNLGELEHFFAEKLSVSFLEDLVFRRRTELDTFNFQDGTVEHVLRLVFHSNAVLTSSNFSQIRSLIIDHEEDYKRRTIIENCNFTRVFSDGIHIKRGYVDMDSVSFRTPAPSMIFMSGTSKLFLRRMTKDHLDCSWFTVVVKAISVQRRSQVVYEGQAAPAWLLECLDIQTSLEARQLKSLDKYHVLDPSDCTADSSGLVLRCLLTNSGKLEKPIQLGLHPGLDKYTSVELTGVKDLVIGENCFSEITLMDTHCSLIEAAEDSCYSHLRLYNSKLQDISGNLWKLLMENSVAIKISPSSPVELVHVESSEIGNINFVGSILYFRNVTFHNIHSLNVTKELTVINCTIKYNNSLNIEIENTAGAIFKDTIINLLTISAIVVKGRLTMENVTIKSGNLSGIEQFPRANVSLLSIKFSSLNETFYETKTWLPHIGQKIAENKNWKKVFGDIGSSTTERNHFDEPLYPTDSEKKSVTDVVFTSSSEPPAITDANNESLVNLDDGDPSGNTTEIDAIDFKDGEDSYPSEMLIFVAVLITGICVVCIIMVLASIVFDYKRRSKTFSNLGSYLRRLGSPRSDAGTNDYGQMTGGHSNPAMAPTVSEAAELLNDSTQDDLSNAGGIQMDQRQSLSSTSSSFAYVETPGLETENTGSTRPGFPSIYATPPNYPIPQPPHVAETRESPSNSPFHQPPQVFGPSGAPPNYQNHQPPQVFGPSGAPPNYQNHQPPQVAVPSGAPSNYQNHQPPQVDGAPSDIYYNPEDSVVQDERRLEHLYETIPGESDYSDSDEYRDRLSLEQPLTDAIRQNPLEHEYENFSVI